LNEVYSSLAARRRYEVWFVRVGLADSSGAWFRYLLMNPGRDGCPQDAGGMPVQVWATWFPSEGKPRSFIQGFPLRELEISPRGQSPFHFKAGENAIDETSCCGAIDGGGCAISWDLRYRSTFRVTLSNKGWIGFSRTAHSDAVFSGHIKFDGRSFSTDPLGCGVQGHNCGYRHRNSWSWAHAFFPRPEGPPSTFEALTYEMPLGLVFRRAVLWHNREPHVFHKLRQERRDPKKLLWDFRCSSRHGFELEAAIDGSGSGVHRIPYVKTDCRGSFEVANNSLARAVLRLHGRGGAVEELETRGGAVLEMVGN